MSSDVIVIGDYYEAKGTVMEITSSIPWLRPLDGGSLRNAVGMEMFVAVLLNETSATRCGRVCGSLRS